MLPSGTEIEVKPPESCLWPNAMQVCPYSCPTTLSFHNKFHTKNTTTHLDAHSQLTRILVVGSLSIKRFSSSLLLVGTKTHFKMPQYYQVVPEKPLRETEETTHSCQCCWWYILVLLYLLLWWFCGGTYTKSLGHRFMCKIFKHRTWKNGSREILHKLDYSQSSCASDCIIIIAGGVAQMRPGEWKIGKCVVKQNNNKWGVIIIQQLCKPIAEDYAGTCYLLFLFLSCSIYCPGIHNCFYPFSSNKPSS